ncbi:TetR family transcriptional regulator [Rhizocola hellebori]|uniref:TetR family transcriptional regulator n=1 Tax=Rhizocola hellebori TaxID=1392758 RepID=A0A8J3Q8V3_9ACTN|nr:TetR/AcrR family transcriptional regulator [Rhizocola hellebori]GIH05584.1 TetR family transcriptional regulator [Rhizocola hellebori]
MTTPRWDPRRLNAVAADLPEGVTPPGTRGRILVAALSLFAEYGFHGTSIRDIAAGIGINSATLYGHYPSKEHILAALVLIGHEELHHRMQQAVVDTDADPVAQVAALVRAQVLAHTDFPLLALVANQELHALSPERAAPALALREQSRDLALRVLRRGVQLQVFDVADITLAAIAISSMGVRVANWFGPDQPYTRDQVADAFADFALRLTGATLPARRRDPGEPR